MARACAFEKAVPDAIVEFDRVGVMQKHKNLRMHEDRLLQQTGRAGFRVVLIDGPNRGAMYAIHVGENPLDLAADAKPRSERIYHVRANKGVPFAEVNQIRLARIRPEAVEWHSWQIARADVEMRGKRIAGRVPFAAKFRMRQCEFRLGGPEIA